MLIAHTTAYQMRFPRIAARQQKSFLHPQSSTNRRRRDQHGRALATRASKNHARVNQSPVVCILRSIGPKFGPTAIALDAERVRKPYVGPVAVEFKRVFAWNRALSMQMIGARENGTRHRETRELLPLSSHLGYHLLYEPCTKHDDGNDAWRRYWAGLKCLVLKVCVCARARSRVCVCVRVNAGRFAIDGTKGLSDHVISGRTAGRCSKYWIRIVERRDRIDIIYVRLSANLCFVRNFTYVDTAN